MVRYAEKIVKKALTKSKIGYNTFAINPYIGCEHGCIYCYSPYTLHIEPNKFHSNIYVKRNLPSALIKELKNLRDCQIFIGTATDAYQPCESKYQISRKILEIISKKKLNTIILTKSSLIERDRELIEKMRVEVGFTITTLEEDQRKIIEPYASSIHDRLRSLKTLSEMTTTYVFIGPILPNLTDPLCIIEETKDYAKYYLIDKLRPRKDMLQRISKILGIDFFELEEFNLKIKKLLKNLSYGNIKILF